MTTADLILTLHFGFIAFVVAGQLLVMIGYHRQWRWATNRTMRFIHVGCVLYIIVQSWAGKWCPLTILENKYRMEAGQTTYQESFVQHWVGKLVYYDAPHEVFLGVYTLFGLLVLTYWVLIEVKGSIRGSI